MAKKNPAKTKWMRNPDFKAPKAPAAAPQPDDDTEPDTEPDTGDTEPDTGSGTDLPGPDDIP